MSSIKVPMHPGEFLLHAYIEPLELNITTLSSKLDVSQSALSRLVNKKSDLSYEMATRLSYVLGRTPESWMKIQTTYSLCHAKSSLDTDKLQKLIPA